MRAAKKQRPLAQRLEVLKSGANMTTSDLARWLDRPGPTVRSWLTGTLPSGPPGDVEHAYALIALLETLIAKGRYFPLARMSAKERQQRVAEIRQLVLP